MYVVLLLLPAASGHQVFAFNMVFMPFISNAFPSHMPNGISVPLHIHFQFKRSAPIKVK